VEMQIEGSAIAQIKDARFVAALESMGCVPRQAYEGGAGNSLTGTIVGDIREVSFKPDIGVELTRFGGHLST